MADFTANARLTKITTGDETGTWGDTTNDTLDLVDDALGFVSHAMADGNVTITIGDGAASDGRFSVIEITGSWTDNRTLTLGPNTVKKMWVIINATTGGFNLLVSQGSGANVTIGPGLGTIVYGDGVGAGAAVTDALALITGTAATATILANTRTINGTGFNGSQNITITVDADTELDGNTLNSGIVTSSLTQVGVLGGTSRLPANLVTQGTFAAGAYSFAGSTIAAATSITATDFVGDITGLVKTATQGTINHDSLAGFVSDEHVAHTGITFSAGTGLSGGGNLAGNRTFNVESAQGQITSLGVIAALLTTDAGLGVAISSTTFNNMPAATAGKSSLRLIQTGTKPSPGVNGDIWIESTGLFLRAGGNEIGPLTEAGGAEAGSLTGNTLANNVLTSSLTQVGVLMGTSRIPASLVTAGAFASGTFTFDGTVNATTFIGAFTGSSTSCSGLAATATNVAGTGLTGTDMAVGIVTSSLTTVGVIGTGTWQGDSISTTYTDATANTGTVTSVASGDGLSGGTITVGGTLTVDNTVIRTTGDQTLAGIKTFSSTIVGSVNGNAATATSATTAGTVTTAAQGAITSVGILTSLTCSGDITLTGSSSDVIVAATAKLRLDGSASGNTYISETSADTCTIFTNGVGHFLANTTGVQVLGSHVSQFILQVFQTGGASAEVAHLNFSGYNPDDNVDRFLTCSTTGGNKMQVYSDGDVNTADAGTLTSDETLKENIVTTTPKLSDVLALRVINYNWDVNSDLHNPGSETQTRKRIGYGAQAVEQIFPGLVNEHRVRDAVVDEDDVEITPAVWKKSVRQGTIGSPILVKAFQEYVAQTDARLALLENP